MIMRKIEEEQLKVFYYFMMSDGKCTSEELDKFVQICNEMDVGQDDMSKIARECELAVDTSGKDCSMRVKKVLYALLEDDVRGYGDWQRLKSDKQKQIYVIWNLINLGYADKDFSESERNVIDFLAEHWKINEQLLLEMLDIADTMLALTKQKDWIKTTSKPYDSIREVVEEADRDMEKLKKSIELTLKNACKEV